MLCRYLEAGANDNSFTLPGPCCGLIPIFHSRGGGILKLQDDLASALSALDMDFVKIPGFDVVPDGEYWTVVEVRKAARPQPDGSYAQIPGKVMGGWSNGMLDFPPFHGSVTLRSSGRELLPGRGRYPPRLILLPHQVTEWP